MKKIGLLILGVTLHLYTLSQSPAGFSYQGVLRNTEGQVLANKTASLMVSLTNSSGVDVYYTETHSLTTNALGLFSLVVGQGTITSGAMSSIPWGQGGVYLKLDVKPDGATSYVSMGVQQLQSVPYALYAADGLGINWLGELSVPPADPVKNQAYYNSTDKKAYIWDGDSWEIIAMDGFPGLVGEAGPQGSQGIPGVNGVSISWLGSSIAAPASPDINNAYYNSTDKKSYIWDGDSWEIISMDGLQGSTGDVGPQGPQGIQGIQGEAGPQGIQGEVGPKGDQGVQGEIGPQGPQGLQGEVGPEGPRGPAGVGLTLRGNWSADSIYIEGDYVFDESSSTVGVNSMWICQNPVGPSVSHPKEDSTNWVEFEAPEGPQGPQGPEGPLVAGITGQTLRHDGTTWVANSMLYNNGTNIGIGTTAPDKILTVKSLTANTQIAKFADDARYIGVGRDEIGSYDLAGNYATLGLNGGALTLTASGNLGLGLSAPLAKLHINTTGNPRAFRISGTASNDYTEAQFAGDGREFRIGVGGSAVTNGSANKFYLYDNNALAFRMILDQSGNVGIGTVSPTHKLQIHNQNVDAHLYISSSAPSIKFGNSEIFASSTMFGLFALATSNGNYGLSAGDVILGTYGNSRGNIYINSNYSGSGVKNIIMQPSGGNVGIGTTNPGSYKLNVSGGNVLIGDGTGLAGILRLTGHSYVGSADWGNLSLFAGSNSGNACIIFSTEGTEKAYITGPGNLGVGVWPSHRFHVAGGNGVINNVFLGDVGHGANWAALANSSSANTTGYALLQSADGLYTLLNRKSGAGYIGFRIDNVDQMVIANSGYVGIGTNGPDAKLKIENGGFAIGQGNATNDTYGGYRTIQLTTQNGIEGGTYDNHTGALIWSTLESGGWGDGRLKVALGTNWGTYNTANPALVVGQNFLGVGSASTNGLVIQGSSTNPAVPLFQVKDKNGLPVFLVYQDSVRIIVKDEGTKDSKGIFAVSGRNTSKVLTNQFMRITPDNTIIGAQAGHANPTGIRNVLVGHKSGYSITTAWGNIAIGEEAMVSNSTGTYNIAIGQYALKSLQVTSSNNIAIGNQSLYNSLGGENIAIGQSALGSNTYGSSNVAIGRASLFNNNMGSNMTAIGNYTSINSSVVGNSTALGYQAAITANNQVRIGNSSVTSIGGQVGWSTLSDKRFKKEVKGNVPGLEFIMKLRPITYYLDIDKIAAFLNTPDSLRLFDMEKEKANMLLTGFAAQEVEEAALSIGYVFSGVDKAKNEKDYYGLRYSEFTVPLVKAVQELSTEVDSQKKKIEQQNILIDELIKRIERLEIKMKSTPSETVNY